MEAMKAKILIAEDNNGLRLLYSKMLERHGHEVVSVTNGAEALSALIADETFSVLLLDLMMPQMDGMKFLEKSKVILMDQKVKICVLSALSEEERIRECLLLGADDYIIKLADEELLINKIQFLLGHPPKYEYSKIECKHKESVLVDSAYIDITVTEIHEDYFIFKTKYDLKSGTRITINRGEIRNIMMASSREIMARVFRAQRSAGSTIAFANYIGLNENQIKSLRSQTVIEGEEKNEK